MPSDVEPSFQTIKPIDETILKPKTETPVFIPPIEYTPTPQLTDSNPLSDQQQVQSLSQEIKIKATNPEETPVTPKTETLFKNCPSLYEQYHEEYNRECKSFKGYLHRQIDIHRLKKKGIKDAQELYDGLRSRGIDRQHIVNKNNYIDPKNITAQDFLKGVDRLYKVNIIEPSTYFANKKGSTLKQISRIIEKTEQQFDVTYNTLNQYNFLRNSNALTELIMGNVYHFNNKGDPILPEEWTLEELYCNFFSVPEIETAFNQSKSQLSELDQKSIFDFLACDSINVDLLFRTLINSDINPGQKIEIPHNLRVSFHKNGESSKWLQILSRLSNRDQQKKFIDNVQVGSSSYLGELFSEKLLNSLETKDQLLINSILSLKNIDKEMAQFLSANKDNIHSYFNDNGLPTSLFFEELTKRNFHNTILFKSNFTQKAFDSFSLEDKKMWKFMQDKNISLKENEKVISDKLLKFIIVNKPQLASSLEDIDFLNILINNFGTNSETFIRGYYDCLISGVITKNEKTLVLNLLKEFRVLTPNIIKGYKDAVLTKTDKLFVSCLREISQKLTSSKRLSDKERQSPYYQDLIKHVYPNNADKWASYKSNDSCSDRSSDLSQFKIEDFYQIDLLSQGEILIKDGQQADESVQYKSELAISKVMEELRNIEFNQETGNQLLNQKAETILSSINIPDGITLSQLSLEEKLFLVVSEYTYNHQKIDLNDIKNLLITYEFVNFEDIRNYIQGTNDKTSQAHNQNYAHLCELSNFYSDKIKEVNKRIIESASVSPHISKLFPFYFKSLSQQNSEQTVENNLNKFQVDKLGLSNSFLDQINKVLKRRFPEKQYNPDQIKRMLHIYETISQGLIESKSNSPNVNTQALYGLLRSQREKTINASKQLGNEYIDPQSIHLDEISLEQALNLEKSIQSGGFNQDEFIAYTAQKFIDIFEKEKRQIETELSKYKSTTGKQRETIISYITKTKESANARMVGGVCVSGDNPDKDKQKNLWDTPNYFQMVFQDPETYRCLGLCLLHHFQENGKKILTVSFDPSSTYLYKVDEDSLFNGIMSQLQSFALNNDFDIITTSQNKIIRTNRVGGNFEKSIDKRVSQINKPFHFSSEKQFSYRPDYSIKDMDIIWQNPTNR